jgi:hypothetical protein
MKLIVLALVMLAAACGGGERTTEGGSQGGTTMGAEAQAAMDANNVVTSTAVPAAPIGVIRDARETAEQANQHVAQIDSLMRAAEGTPSVEPGP